ncbi:MAG: c-type cytochrome [Gammaproteobacteria bacterium]|nr:c-type cytochrome [Gammaproteobacteria bacterium]
MHRPAAIAATRSAILGILISFLIGELAGAPLTDAEQRGRLIYQEGRTSSGYPFMVKLPYSPAPLAGRAFPCAACHGADGRGGSEGGIDVPDIRWQTLTKPHDTAKRTRGPYTKRALRDALTRGLDPARNPLNPVMPRFQISLTDFDHLFAYLQRLGGNLQASGLQPSGAGHARPPPEPQ